SNVPARGVEIEEVVFEDRVRVHDLPLVVAHTGLMRRKIVFRGYVAALYLGEGISPDDWSADVPKPLEIVYFSPIDGKTFVEQGRRFSRATYRRKRWLVFTRGSSA